jgi:C4-dicarboxylate-binding protein DctP
MVPVEKMSDGLKDRSIDGVTVGLAAIFSREFWKVSDTITRTAHAALEFLLAINEKSFQSLSPAHRTIVIEAARAVERETRDKLAEFEAKAVGFARSKGMRVVALTPDQVAEWRACSAEMVADFMDKNGELARRLMAAYGRLRTDPCCSAGPAAGVAFTRR